MRHLQPALLAAMTATALLTGSAHAYHPLITDDTGTQGTGGNQLEFVYDAQKSRLEGVSTMTRSGSVTFTRGVTDNLDLYVAGAHQSSPRSGFQNTAIGGKWRFWENETQGKSLALKTEIRLPVSRSDEEAGLGTGKTSWGLIGIFTSTTSFGELHFNLAADRNNTAAPSTDRSTIFRLSLAPVWHINDRWKAGLDSGFETNPNRSEQSYLAYGQLGLIYSPDKNLDLSLGVRRNFRDGPLTTTAATLGVTWRF